MKNMLKLLIKIANKKYNEHGDKNERNFKKI